MRLSAACVCVCVWRRERGVDACIRIFCVCGGRRANVRTMILIPFAPGHQGYTYKHTLAASDRVHTLSPPSPHRAVFMLIGCHGNHTHTHTRHCVRNVFQPSTSHRVVRRVASRLDGCANSEQKRSEARDDDDNNVVCVCVGESYDV